MVADTDTSFERQPRRTSRVLIATAAFAFAVAIPATAFAGKGSGGTTSGSWISLASVDGAKSSSVQPTLGASVKFATGYPTGTKNPWVSVTCWQNGSMVYGEGNAPSADFILGGASSVWTSVGGSATCNAELGDLYWRGGKQYYTFLATTSFEAAQ
jgi:hypothetical protein